jgi:hypothetical protein
MFDDLLLHGMVSHRRACRRQRLMADRRILVDSGGFLVDFVGFCWTCQPQITKLALISLDIPQ